MAGITAAGLGSGMDISSLVSQLVAAERNPADKRLDKRETTLQAKISAIGSFKSALSGFQSALASLKKTDTFQSMKATVADDSLFTATTDNSAQMGSYNIKVEQLAQAHRLATPADQTFASTSAVVGTGTLTFQFGTYDSDSAFTINPNKSVQTVTIDTSNNTLAGVRDAINQADIGVTASIVNDGNGYRLVMGAKDSGAANSLKITAGDASLSLLAFDPTTSETDRSTKQTVAAANARIVVDGLAVTSASNTLKEVIPGVTLNLKAKGDAATSLTVGQDAAGITKTLESFISAYNSLRSTVKSLTAYNADTKTAAALAGDYDVRSTVNKINQVLTSSVAGVSGSFKSLADIGVSLQRDGTLKLDSAKLGAALSSDTESVANLFARNVSADPQTGSDGIACQLDSLLTDVFDSDSGLSNRTKSLKNQLDEIDDARDKLEVRMSALEARYKTQFTAMDLLVSRLSSTGNYLTQQFSSSSS